VTDQFNKSVVLLRDLLEQQAAAANANHEYQQSLLAFWSAKANFDKALGRSEKGETQSNSRSCNYRFHYCPAACGMQRIRDS
jgi:outer membrane protein TolC